MHRTWCGYKHHQTQVAQAAQAAGWHYILLMLWLELEARAPAERVEKASAGFTLDQLATACQSKNLCNDAGLPQNHFNHHSPPFPEPSEDGDGVDDAGLPHIHLLEAALQGRVLLNVLPVLVQGGGADAAQLATPKHGLQQVAYREGRGDSVQLQRGLPSAAHRCCQMHFLGRGNADAQQLATAQHWLQQLPAAEGHCVSQLQVPHAWPH